MPSLRASKPGETEFSPTKEPHGAKASTRPGLETRRRVHPHRPARAPGSRIQSGEEPKDRRRNPSPRQQEGFLPPAQVGHSAGAKTASRHFTATSAAGLTAAASAVGPRCEGIQSGQKLWFPTLSPGSGVALIWLWMASRAQVRPWRNGAPVSAPARFNRSLHAGSETGVPAVHGRAPSP
jgi:hypothetical protein